MPAADNLVGFLQLIRPQVPHTVRRPQVRQFAVQELVLSVELSCCIFFTGWFSICLTVLLSGLQ